MPQFWLRAAAIAAAAYFCGCFNGAVIVSKYILRDDVRKHGSGNAGLTNFFRTFGGPLTLLVLALDIIKAIVAVLVGAALANGFEPALWNGAPGIYGKYWAALFCLLGHMFPCMFGFRGGKGILSGGTVLWMVDWRIGLVCWGLFLLLAILTRYVSLGSCCAGAAFPFATWLFQRDLILTALAAAIGGLILFQHRGNLQRLLSGTENKLSFHRKKGGT